MDLKDFLEEASIMKEMKHPNLVQLLGEWVKGRAKISDSSNVSAVHEGSTWWLSG